ncbi:helix-turn-helix domain-containing protein [Parasphingorhabdus sp.]|uniref:helix-turn-helix domain-containing protein n=1 Tax=Parasphingorhabdus sp. TaxID=2709688 RepID=UPI002F951D85
MLLSAIGLNDADLRDPRNQFSARNIATLYHATAKELKRENIIREIGRGMMPTGFSDIGHAAMFEESLGGVMQAAVAAIDSSFNVPLLSWEQTETSCRLVVNPDHNISSDLVFIIFAALAHMAGTVIGEIRTNGQAARMASYPQPLKTALFRSRPPRHCDGFFKSAGGLPDGPVFLFEQSENSLELHHDIMALANPFANREVVYAANSHAKRYLADASESVSLNRLCYTYLFPLLDRSGLSIDAAAETFGMAERTLRRKLAAEGASFRQILEQVRRNSCQLYFLEGTRSLSEIATKLGYSELSAFTRAYTAWYGHSPSQGMAEEVAVAVAA